VFDTTYNKELDIMYYRTLEDTDKGWKITIPVPGAKHEDIKVKFENDKLFVDIDRNDNFVGIHSEYHVIPKGVKEEHISAKLKKDGLLVIEIKKPEGYSAEIKVQ
jgi:HSP20 family molecular chaperone IbpA